jgi:hypothetical protein
VIALAPPSNDRDAVVGHAPHPWGEGTRFPGEWEPRDAVKVIATQYRVRPESHDDRAVSVEQKRERPTWFKVSSGAAALLVAILLAMWAHDGPATCAVSFDFPRRLHLDRPVDREHLAADGASAMRAARRYASGAAGEEQQRRFLECEDLLVSAIAERHGVSVGQVQVATGQAR